mgnify:CR=1 FL=1
MNDASVVKTVIDICSRSFTILSDEGDVQVVYCDSTQEFMDVFDVVKTVSYTHLTLPTIVLV